MINYCTIRLSKLRENIFGGKIQYEIIKIYFIFHNNIK